VICKKFVVSECSGCYKPYNLATYQLAVNQFSDWLTADWRLHGLVCLLKCLM